MVGEVGRNYLHSKEITSNKED